MTGPILVDYTIVRGKVEALLEDNFTETNIVFENTKEKPEDSEYISVYDADTDSRSMGMGEVVSQISGILSIEIYTAYGTGTNRAKEIASSLVSILNNGAIPEMDFISHKLRSVGKVDGKNLYQHVLQVPYSYMYGQTEE